MNVAPRLGLRVGLFVLPAISALALSQANTVAASPFPSTLGSHSTPSNRVEFSDRKLSSTTAESESGIPFQIDEGEGGTFTYEIWQTLYGSDYYLFIWNDAHYETDEPTAAYSFASATEAMNFFTCRYARVRQASCNLLISSVRYDIPETCAFPWKSCVDPQ